MRPVTSPVSARPVVPLNLDDHAGRRRGAAEGLRCRRGRVGVDRPARRFASMSCRSGYTACRLTLPGTTGGGHRLLSGRPPVLHLWPASSDA